MAFYSKDVFDVVIWFGGLLLLFRKVGVIQRQYTWRVFLLTAVLSCILIYFFSALSSFVNPTIDGCLLCNNQY